jgi:hypothetical protein
MVSEALHEHAATLCAAVLWNRSRCLIKCAKDCGQQGSGHAADWETARGASRGGSAVPSRCYS